MALSPKERERIIEEEQLRFETRQTLARERCAKHRPSRWLWWIAIAAVLYAAVSMMHCGGARCPMGYHGAWMQDGKTCHHDWSEQEEKVEPGQPLPPKK